MKHCVGILLAALLIVSVMASLALAGDFGVKEVRPSVYQSNGAQIAGWNWLCSANANATWDFPALAGYDGKSVAVCLDGLSTNTTSGGSGYASKVEIEISVAGGAPRPPRPVLMTLKNPVPIVTPSNSNGVGYHTYGCVRIKGARLGLEAQPFKVTARYKGGHHTAVRQASAYVVYTTP